MISRWLSGLLACIGMVCSGAEELPELSAQEAQKLTELIQLAETNDPGVRVALEALGEERHALFDVLLGDVLAGGSENAAAATAYASAMEKAPDYGPARLRLARIRLLDGKPAEVPPLIAPLLKQGRGGAEAYALLGQSWLTLDRSVSAESAFRQWLLHDGSSLDARFGLAQALLDQERWGEVGGLANELVEEAPARLDLWRLRAAVAERSSGGRERSFVILETAKRLGVLKGVDVADLGDQAADLGLVEEAVAAYDTAFSRLSQPAESSSVDGSRVLRAGEMLMASGADDAARQWLEASKPSEAAAPDLKARWFRLAAMLADRAGDGSGALAYWQSALESDPLDGRAMMALANSWREGAPAKARQWMLRASRQHRVQRQALLRLAEWAVEDGMWDDALRYVQEARSAKDDPRLRRYADQLRAWIEEQ